MKQRLIYSIAPFLLSAGFICYGQQEPSPRPRSQPQERQAPPQATPVTLQGCLVKGTQAQTYIITDDKTRENVTFAGPDKLDSYVNQTVQITGEMVDRGSDRMFRPQSVKSIASTCTKTNK